jgi:radical SAM protein with 4Fe4S-binding SPASM domain
MAPFQDPLPEHPSRLPWVLGLQVFSGCNLECAFCAYKDVRKTNPRRPMPMELFRKVVDELSEHGLLRSVCFSLQCEPLLDRDLGARIRYVKAKDRRVGTSLSTNATLLTPDRLSELCRAGLDSVAVTLNALSERTFRKVCGTGGFQRTIDNVLNLVRNRPAGLSVSVSSMLVKENVAEMIHRQHPIYEEMERAGIKGGMGPISNHCGSLSGYEEQLILPELQSSRRKTYCHDIFESLNILADGDVLACCSDWRRKHVLGNVAERSLLALWRSERAKTRRQEMMHADLRELDPCRECSQAWNIMRNRDSSRNEEPRHLPGHAAGGAPGRNRGQVPREEGE